MNSPINLSGNTKPSYENSRDYSATRRKEGRETKGKTVREGRERMMESSTEDSEREAMAGEG